MWINRNSSETVRQRSRQRHREDSDARGHRDRERADGFTETHRAGRDERDRQGAEQIGATVLGHAQSDTPPYLPARRLLQQLGRGCSAICSCFSSSTKVGGFPQSQANEHRHRDQEDRGQERNPPQPAEEHFIRDQTEQRPHGGSQQRARLDADER